MGGRPCCPCPFQRGRGERSPPHAPFSSCDIINPAPCPGETLDKMNTKRSMISNFRQTAAGQTVRKQFGIDLVLSSCFVRGGLPRVLFLPSFPNQCCCRSPCFRMLKFVVSSPRSLLPPVPPTCPVLGYSFFDITRDVVVSDRPGTDMGKYQRFALSHSTLSFVVFLCSKMHRLPSSFHSEALFLSNPPPSPSPSSFLFAFQT